jgi:hypothetical protein
LNFITTMLSALMLSHAIKLDLVSFTPMVCYRSIGKPSGSLNQILDRSLWTKSVQLLATHKYRDRQYSPRSIRGSGTWVRSPFQFREYHLLIYFIFICMRWKKIVWASSDVMIPHEEICCVSGLMFRGSWRSNLHCWIRADGITDRFQPSVRPKCTVTPNDECEKFEVKTISMMQDPWCLLPSAANWNTAFCEIFI